MKIKQMLSQNRRDFSAILVCEHCQAEEKLTTGYDDHFYHTKVIPAMVCKSCNQAAPEDFRAQMPKYDAYQTI